MPLFMVEPVWICLLYTSQGHHRIQIAFPGNKEDDLPAEGKQSHHSRSHHHDERVEDIVDVYKRQGQPFTLTTREVEGTKEICSVTYKDLPQDVQPGGTIMLDDGCLLYTSRCV